MFNRRKFIKASALSAGLLAIDKTSMADAIPNHSNNKANFPIVISTWDFGIAANADAWKVLSKGGRALDAVEQGVWVPEADEKNQTVGYGGLPDRDGKVTLDACI
ncbi:MAG: glycosylasparaginase, partial [Pedobacter sp.]